MPLFELRNFKAIQKYVNGQKVLYQLKKEEIWHTADQFKQVQPSICSYSNIYLPTSEFISGQLQTLILQKKIFPKTEINFLT